MRDHPFHNLEHQWTSHFTQHLPDLHCLISPTILAITPLLLQPVLLEMRVVDLVHLFQGHGQTPVDGLREEEPSQTSQDGDDGKDYARQPEHVLGLEEENYKLDLHIIM